MEKFTPLSQLTPEEKKARQEEKALQAALAVKEHTETQKAFYRNYERLRAERLAREANDGK